MRSLTREARTRAESCRESLQTRVARQARSSSVILTHGDFDAIPGLTATGKVACVKPLGENKQGDMTYTVVVPARPA